MTNFLCARKIRKMQFINRLVTLFYFILMLSLKTLHTVHSDFSHLHHLLSTQYHFLYAQNLRVK